jgi:vacuolar iron transporter family protein
MTHQEKHLKNSDLITDIVIGMSDGLTVPFALAAGITSVVTNNQIVTTAGIAEIIAGSIAMGLGGYLAGRTEIDHYKSELSKEYHEVETIPEKEKEEIKEIFADYGLSINSQNLIAEELSKDKDKWVKFMMKFELGLEEPHSKRAATSAITIGVSYIIGGFIPLSPYFFTTVPTEGLKISAAITLVSLFIFGYLKSKVTGQPVISGAIKVMIIGAMAASAAFFVAKIFGG